MNYKVDWKVGQYMLEILAKLSGKLLPFRKLIYLAMIILAGVIITQLLQAPSPSKPSNAVSILSLVGLIWLLLFNILLSTFHNIPRVDDDTKSRLTLVKIKVKRGVFHVLALLFVGLTLVIIFLSVRMLRI
jgi:hypothetical protein